MASLLHRPPPLNTSKLFSSHLGSVGDAEYSPTRVALVKKLGIASWYVSGRPHPINLPLVTLSHTSLTLFLSLSLSFPVCVAGGGGGRRRVQVRAPRKEQGFQRGCDTSLEEQLEVMSRNTNILSLTPLNIAKAEKPVILFQLPLRPAVWS